MGLELFYCITEKECGFFLVMNLFMSRNIKSTKLFLVSYIKYTNPTDVTYTDGRKDSSETIFPSFIFFKSSVSGKSLL